MNSLTIIKKKLKNTDETSGQLKMQLFFFFLKQHSDGQNKEKQSFGKIVVQLTLN